MKTYIKFLVYGFVKSFFNVFFFMISLVFILNILKEIEYFSNKEVSSLYPVYLSLMSSPSIIFEMFPFIFLITVQLFFIKLYENKEIEILKYTGVKNTKILLILSILSLLAGLLITTFFYHFSSMAEKYPCNFF